MDSRDSPSIGRDRIATLDVIRGVALCGLVPINILDFGIAEDVVFTPGSLKGFELVLWNVVAVFGMGKFMSLFALLFGAGIVLSTARHDASGTPVTARYLKRLGWLWFFGMLHAYLIWHGDILVAYAVTAFVLFWCRRWSVKAQVIWGILLLCVLPVMAVGFGVVLHVADLGPEFWEDSNDDWLTPDEEWIEAFRGGWLDQMPIRALIAVLIQVIGIPCVLFWLAGGLMFLGMALMKTGFFRGDWDLQRYRRWAVTWVSAGIALCAIGTGLYHAVDWAFPGVMLVCPVSYFGTVTLALGYASFGVYRCKVRPGTRTQTVLAAVGRMAFSNYIGQSVILGFVFYGHGLGLYNHLSFLWVMAVVPGVWIFQMIFSALWLRRFQFGPLEWVWRCLTYGRRLPLRRESGAGF